MELTTAPRLRCRVDNSLSLFRAQQFSALVAQRAARLFVSLCFLHQVCVDLLGAELLNGHLLADDSADRRGKLLGGSKLFKLDGRKFFTALFDNAGEFVFELAVRGFASAPRAAARGLAESLPVFNLHEPGAAVRALPAAGLWRGCGAV